MRQIVGFAIAAVLLGGVACRRSAESPKKIPITTSSAEARAAFLKGRDLVDKLRLAEAQPLLDEAISKDPNFAIAHLLRAQTATSTKEFFGHLTAAVAASDRVSEGERLSILGVEAGAGGNSKDRGEYWKKLVTLYPDDEQAHQLLGTHYFGIQEYDSAIAEYQKVVQLAPGFASAYNQLGYSWKAIERDKDAEAAFRKYIELIPNEPNPYDSLAELLLKMGRFDESIQSYQKALSMNAQFLTAYGGIAANLMYQDKHKEAIEQLQKEFDLARNDGDRQRALFELAVCYADEGNLSEALKQISKVSALAEQRGDKATVARIAESQGDLLLNAGKIEEAKAEFARALQLAQQADIPDSVKKISELSNHGNLALVASAKKDFETAKKEAEVMRAGFAELGNPNRMREVHEVLGIVALCQRNYDEAISHLTQADLQSPYVLFQLAKAHAGRKDAEKAKTYYQKVADSHTLPELRYAMVRKAAQKALGK